MILRFFCFLFLDFWKFFFLCVEKLIFLSHRVALVHYFFSDPMCTETVHSIRIQISIRNYRNALCVILNRVQFSPVYRL